MLKLTANNTYTHTLAHAAHYLVLSKVCVYTRVERNKWIQTNRLTATKRREWEHDPFILNFNSATCTSQSPCAVFCVCVWLVFWGKFVVFFSHICIRKWLFIHSFISRTQQRTHVYNIFFNQTPRAAPKFRNCKFFFRFQIQQKKQESTVLQ